MVQRDPQKSRFRRLQDASNAGMTALTIARARRYLEDYPSHGMAWMILGIALTESAHFKEASAALRNAIRHCPPRSRRIPLSQMGHHFEFRGRYSRAAAWYRRAIESAPEEAHSYLYLGDVLARISRLDEAEAAFRSAVRCKTGCVEESYFKLGLVLRAQERFVEAAECFTCALELDPSYPAARKALRDVRRTIRYLR